MAGRAELSIRRLLKYLKRKRRCHHHNKIDVEIARMFHSRTATSCKLDHHRSTSIDEKSILHSQYRHHSSDHRVHHERKVISIETLSPDSSQEDIADALRPYFQTQSPVLLQGLNCNINCRAIESWRSLEYLQSKIGEDTPCLVEVGGSYANPNVQRPEITFGDYILYMKMFQDKYGKCDEMNDSPNQKELVYMAQNDMFPQLWDDFQLPDFCQNPSLKVGNGRLYSTMIWFGPRGCVSPLHFDPLDNLLMQFVGRKRVILYPRSHDLDKIETNGHDQQNPTITPWHYAGHEGQQYNTSPINPNDQDHESLEEKYPLFAKAPVATECLLEPGSMLYIPSKWWHHVTSLDTAISVNAWWR